MNIFLKRVIWLMMLLPAIYLAIVWKNMPQSVPMHFDLHGNVDRYGSKNEMAYLIAGLTVLNAIVYLVVTNVYKIDPKRYAAKNKDRLQRMGFWVSLYLTAIWLMLIYQTLHYNLNNTLKFIFIAMGLLFALIGNNMYNLQPNYFAGIRLPWTLESEDNWRKTHHIAGRLWFYGGFIFAVLALIIKTEWAIYICTAFITILVLIPVIYSYKLYKKQTKNT